MYCGIQADRDLVAARQFPKSAGAALGTRVAENYAVTHSTIEALPGFIKDPIQGFVREGVKADKAKIGAIDSNAVSTPDVPDADKQAIKNLLTPPTN